MRTTLSRARLRYSIDYISLCMRLHNAWRELMRQWRQHGASAILIVIGVILIAVKFNTWQVPKAPIWLSEYAGVACSMLIAWALWSCHNRCQLGLLQLHDWLAAQPIAQRERRDFLRLKLALFSASELGFLSVLALWFADAHAAGWVALIGAILCCVRVAWLGTMDVLASGREATLTQHSAFKPVKNSPPMRAIFLGTVPSAARFRFWWLLPLLVVPMGAKLALIASVLLGFLLIMHFVALNSALASGLMQLALFTRAQPLTPAHCYRIALRFCLHPLLILFALLLLALLITQFFGASAVATAQLIAVLGALGVWLLGNQLHLQFAFRFEPAKASVRWRGEIALLLLLAMGITFAPLLPLMVVASWRWLYQRGLHF